MPEVLLLTDSGGRSFPLTLGTRLFGVLNMSPVKESNIDRNRRLSPLEAMGTGIFRLLELISIAGLVQNCLNARNSRTAAVWFTDLYLISWWAFELCIYLNSKRGLPLLLLIVITYRILELTQVYANLLVFFRLRRGSGPHKMYSPARRVLIAFACYVELAVLFGLLYWQFRANLHGAIFTPADAFYFSVATMTTVGYGDVFALGWLRLLVAGQVLLGLFFAIGLLGRFVSLLPASDSEDS